MPTIYDVAKEAGVSIGTVSYVLNNKGRVGKKTRDRVWRAVQKLNYEPRTAAQALATGHTYTIALVAPMNIYGYQMSLIDLMKSVGQKLRETDYRLFIHPTLSTESAWSELKADVGGHQMDGVILLHVEEDDPRVEVLKKAKLPFVLIGRCEDTKDIHYVDADIEAAVQSAIHHLHDMGHQSIGLIGEAGEARITDLLLSYFSEAMCKHQLEVRSEWCVQVPEGPDPATQAALKMLSAPEKPTAIFALSDATVLGTYNAARLLNLRLPQDVAVIGYADSPMYPYLNPPCSAVFGNSSRLGTIAAEMMLALLYGEALENHQILVPPDLVVRESTKQA